VPTLPTPHDLAREVVQLELLEQRATVELERVAIFADQATQLVEGIVGPVSGELHERDDQRRLVDDLNPSIDRMGEL
jgi:hypothetical protein